MAWAHDPSRPAAPMHPLVRRRSTVEDPIRVDPNSLPTAGIRTGIAPRTHASAGLPPPAAHPIYDNALRIGSPHLLDERVAAPYASRGIDLNGDAPTVNEHGE